MTKMNMERVAFLNDHLKTLTELAKQKVAVYREINDVTRAINLEIQDTYFHSGIQVNLGYHIANNDAVSWDDINSVATVSGRIHVPVVDVIQQVRISGSVKAAAEELSLTEVEVSNVLCFAARVIGDSRY